MKFLQFLLFLGSFLGPTGVLEVNLKSPEISAITNLTKLNLCGLSVLGNTLEVKYKFGAWPTL